MNNFLKVLGFVFAALFIWAAAVQYNDPDSLRWYLIYGVAALASILFALDRLKLLWALLLSLFYIGFGLYNWPQKFEGVTIGEGDIGNIEKGREALGMIFTGAIMLFYVLVIKLRPKS